jgi:hypothetical protein
MKYYKLTNQGGRTYGGTQWGENVTHRAWGWGRKLCSEDVIHVYDSPYKAVLFNPIHASFREPRLWECRVRKVVANDQLKVGVKQCTTIREIPLPKITTEQRVKFAILCALEVYHNPAFVTWANNWLSNTDRSARSVSAAAEDAKAAWAWAAASAAAKAAWAWAAASEDAKAAWAWAAASAAAEAAWAAARAAIPFSKLIREALK